MEDRFIVEWDLTICRTAAQVIVSRIIKQCCALATIQAESGTAADGDRLPTETHKMIITSNVVV